MENIGGATMNTTNTSFQNNGATMEANARNYMQMSRGEEVKVQNNQPEKDGGEVRREVGRNDTRHQVDIILDRINSDGLTIHEVMKKLANRELRNNNDRARKDAVDGEFEEAKQERDGNNSNQEIFPDGKNKNDKTPTAEKKGAYVIPIKALQDPEFREMWAEQKRLAQESGEEVVTAEVDQRTMDAYYEKKSREVSSTQAIPDEILNDPKFQELYKDHIMESVKDGKIPEHEKVREKALADYLKEMDMQQEGQIFNKLKDTELPSDMVNTLQQIEQMRNQIHDMAKNQEEMTAQMREMGQRIREMELLLLLQILQKYLEEEKKKKDRDKNKVNVLEAIGKLIALFMAELMVDDEEERKKVNKNVKGDNDDEKDNPLDTLIASVA